MVTLGAELVGTPVGADVGTDEGTEVGEDVGYNVGRADGRGVGVSVGAPVDGTAVGRGVEGAPVEGTAVGSAVVGRKLGSPGPGLGRGVGGKDGGAVGSYVGSMLVGVGVGSKVVGGAVGVNVGAGVGVGATVGEAVGASVRVTTPVIETVLCPTADIAFTVTAPLSGITKSAFCPIWRVPSHVPPGNVAPVAMNAKSPLVEDIATCNVSPAKYVVTTAPFLFTDTLLAKLLTGCTSMMNNVTSTKVPLSQSARKFEAYELTP